jgi:glycosyltransferase involved in cell wall biosynthesis
MNIFSFSDQKDSDKEYKYKVLVYPNITWSKDLTKDSFVVVIHNIINNLRKIRSDIHWTLLLPEELPIFRSDDITQFIYKVPSYPNQMRCHFDTKALLELIDWKNCDFDVVYSHLPEHTLQLKNLFYNMTNIRPLFVGYSHWTEFPEITEYPMSVIDNNFLGLLEMSKCGINTIAQRDLVLKHAKKHLNEKTVESLGNVVVPHYLGWEIPKYEKRMKKMLTIVFNHRPHEYKNYPWFLEQMDELRKTYKNFAVWVPLAEKPDREYIYVGDNSTRFEYMSNLSACQIGVCGKQKYAGWSVSATDGMSVGVPYLFSDDDYYHELAGDAGIYYNGDEDFQLKMSEFLMDPSSSLRKSWSKKALNRFNSSTWDKAIVPINDMLQETFDSLPKIGEATDSYQEIVKFIQREKSVSKNDILEHLNWGIRIAFSQYRNRLRTESNIIFTKNRYEFRS